MAKLNSGERMIVAGVAVLPAIVGVAGIFIAEAAT